MTHSALSMQYLIRKLSIVSLSALALLATTALAGEQKLPEVDTDGLHLVKDSNVQIAYIKPGADFSKFDKVILLDCFVEFREKWAKDYNLDALGLQGRVTDRDVERIKQDLATEFREVFSEELAEDGFPVADQPGPGVLLLRPAIVNLDIAAPAMMKANRGNTWVRSAGQMTLYMEMYDAETDELLARVIDPKADSGSMSKIASSATNQAAARRIIRRWASLLSDHLMEVRGGASS